MTYKLLPHSLLTVATLSGFNYSTYYQHPRSSDKPYVLLIHGFPSSAYDWRHQVDYFSQNGYGLIVPDTLGYGRTDKPLDAHDYTLKSISDNVMEVVYAVAGKTQRCMEADMTGKARSFIMCSFTDLDDNTKLRLHIQGFRIVVSCGQFSRRSISLLRLPGWEL